MLSEGARSGAEISECGQYRYVLWRRWAWHGYAHQVMFVGLNASTADGCKNDATIRRCVRYAKDWGYSGMLMLNAYGYRATDPKVMLAAADPIGPHNDEALSYRRSQAGLVVACWGVNCPPGRANAVLGLLMCPVYCLGVTKNGQPKHPVRLRADLKPELYWTPGQASVETRQVVTFGEGE